MADSILTVNHLKKYFKTPKGMLHAVDDVSFSMKRGTTLGIVGESGCGKSILGRSILWLIEPTSGELIFEGKDLLSVKPSEMRHMRKELQIFFRIHILLWIPEKRYIRPSVSLLSSTS